VNSEGLRHGTGIYEMPPGHEYINFKGSWNRGTPINGKLTKENGFVYRGDVNEHYLPHGQGKLTSPEGNSLEGKF